MCPRSPFLPNVLSAPLTTGHTLTLCRAPLHPFFPGKEAKAALKEAERLRTLQVLEDARKVPMDMLAKEWLTVHVSDINTRWGSSLVSPLPCVFARSSVCCPSIPDLEPQRALN